MHIPEHREETDFGDLQPLKRRREYLSQKALYERLGGYDGITAFVNNLMPRLKSDPQLGRFWQNRGDHGVARETQLLIDYLCVNAGGPMYYTGKNMKLLHKGMTISESDWTKFFGHAGATMQALRVPQKECDDVVAFVSRLKGDIGPIRGCATGVR